MVASVSAWVCDAAYQLLLADDRVLKQADELEAVVKDELVGVASHSDGFWDILASACSETSAGDLRSDSISASHVAASFLWFRIVR